MTMLWAISCVDNPNTAVLREKHIQPHRTYLDDRKNILVLGGATLTDDGSQATGSMFIVNARDRAEAKAFSDADPFTQAGIFASVSITRVRKSQWNPDAAENA
jgi:uncharacterized protein YciI